MDDAILEMYCDGAYDRDNHLAGIGFVILRQSDGEEIQARGQSVQCATQNEAEYLAVIHGLKAALALKAWDMRIYTDSMLVVQQIRGTWQVQAENLEPLHAEALDLLKGLPCGWSIEHICSGENWWADALARAQIEIAVG